MADIRSLRGEKMSDSREPVQHVVDKARELMAMAESGEIDGFACAMHYHDNGSGFMRTGRLSAALVGSMEIMKTRMIRDLEE